MGGEHLRDVVGAANQPAELADVKRAPGIWLALALVAAYFVFQIGVGAVIVLGWILIRGGAVTDEAVATLARSGILNGVTVLITAGLTLPAVYLALRGIEHLPVWTSMRFVPPRHLAAWLGVPIALAMAFILDAVTALLNLPAIPQTLLDLYGEQRAGLLLLGLAVVVVAPFMEELLFRGLLFTALEARFGIAAAVVATTALFGVIHVCTYGTDWYPILQTVVLGLALTGLRAWTGSVWPGLVAHVTNNLFSTIQILLWLHSR